MGKGKLAKFADMETYENVFQYPYSVVEHVPFVMRGRWREDFFRNGNPIVLELGCGKGEYTVGLARRYPDVNFIGVDIKGARMWTGATEALREGLRNVAFLRTNIEIIDRFFAPDEVREVWLTFSDPQMKNPRKRLTSTYFLERYRRFLADGGAVHLKTDSRFLFTYTSLLVERNGLPVVACTDDLYAAEGCDTVATDGEAAGGVTSGTGNEKAGGGVSGAAGAFARAASIQTYYESMWMARGLSIKYLQFRLPREGALLEPEVEIELDDYRSYRRDKRSPKATAR